MKCFFFLARERERERESENNCVILSVRRRATIESLTESVCVCERERGRDKGRDSGGGVKVGVEESEFVFIGEKLSSCSENIVSVFEYIEKK